MKLTDGQIACLSALARSLQGMLPLGNGTNILAWDVHVTATRHRVSGRTARTLVTLGLVAIEGSNAKLTDAGRKVAVRLLKEKAQ